MIRSLCLERKKRLRMNHEKNRVLRIKSSFRKKNYGKVWLLLLLLLFSYCLRYPEIEGKIAKIEEKNKAV